MNGCPVLLGPGRRALGNAGDLNGSKLASMDLAAGCAKTEISGKCFGWPLSVHFS